MTGISYMLTEYNIILNLGDIIPKKGNAKKCSNYRTIALISHTSKVMLRVLQAVL